MKKPAYIRKLRAASSGRRPPEEDAFLCFLESLNESDWEKLIVDIVLQRADAFEVFLPPRGEDLLSYSTAFLERLGLPTQTLVGRGLERVVNEGIRSGERQLLNGALFMASALPNSATIEFLSRLVRDPSVDDEIREEAADGLASHPSVVPANFWTTIDLGQHSFLLPSVLTALSQLRPTEALEVLAKTPHRVSPESLEYPLRMIARTLVSTGAGLTQLRHAYRTATEDIRKVLRGIFDLAEFGSITAPWAEEMSVSLVSSPSLLVSTGEKAFALPMQIKTLSPSLVGPCIEDYFKTPLLGPFEEREQLKEYLTETFQMLDGLPRGPIGQKLGQILGEKRSNHEVTEQGVHALWTAVKDAAASDPPSKDSVLPLHFLRGQAEYFEPTWNLREVELVRLLYLFANRDLAELASRVRSAAEMCEIRELTNAVSQFHEDRIFATVIGTLLKNSKFFGWVNASRGWGSLHTYDSGEADVGFRNDFLMSADEKKLGVPVYRFWGYHVFAHRAWVEGLPSDPEVPEEVLLTIGQLLQGPNSGSSPKNLAARSWLVLRGYPRIGFPEVDRLLRVQAKGVNGLSRRNMTHRMLPYDEELELFLRGESNVFIGGAVHARLLRRWWCSDSHTIVQLLDSDHFRAMMAGRGPQNRLFFGGQFNQPPMRPADPREKLQAALIELYLEVGSVLKNVAVAYARDANARRVIEHFSATLLSDEARDRRGKWAFVTEPSDMVGLLTQDDEFLSPRTHR